LNVGNRDIEGTQRGQRFRASQFSPPSSIGRAEPPSSFERSLRPRIVIPVRHIDNANGRSLANRFLKNDATRQRFIVRMWRNEHQSRADIERWSSYS